MERYQAWKWVRERFPKQTATPLRIVIWTLVFLADLVLVFWLAGLLGIDILTLEYRLRTLALGAYLLVSLGLFWAETFLYNIITG